MYSITIPARNKLDVTVECLEGFAGPCDSALRAFWLVDSAISSCGSDMVCAQATTSSFTSTLSYSNPSANPRQVFIIVDVLLADEFWTNMDGGAESALYDIRYNITATNSALAPVPPGDTCWNATRVTVPFDQSSLTVAGFADDVEAERSMCTTLASVLARKDRFYAVTIPGTHAITATLTPASGMSLNPGLALVAPTGDCMDLNTTAMKGCITSASNFDDVVTTLSWRNPDTTPVEAFVIVEGASDTAAFRLQIDVVDAARPANDTCATAEAVTLMDCGAGDGSLCGAVTADTTFANADYFDTRAECGGYPNMPSFPDVAWVLTLPAGRTLSWMTMAEGSMSQANGMLIAGPDPAACSPSSGSRVCLPTNSSGNLGTYTNATGADQTLFFVLRGGGCSTEACFGGALSANFVAFQ